MRTISGCNAVSHFSRTGKLKTFQTLKKPELTDIIDFPSLSLESPSGITSVQYVCYLYEKNRSGSSVNELRYIILPKRI